MSHLALVALIVHDYDEAIRFFIDVLLARAADDEPCGRVAVFLDLEGNRWDLLGPPREHE